MRVSDCEPPCALLTGLTADGGDELVVVVFGSVAEAREFAGRHGIEDWAALPMAFAVDMDRELRAQRPHRSSGA